jgi:hypothetical protein
MQTHADQSAPSCTVMQSRTEQREWYATTHLDSDEEAGGAANVSHGCNGEHVPEGLPVLAVVENAHGRLALALDRVPDDSDRLGVSVRPLRSRSSSLHAHSLTLGTLNTYVNSFSNTSVA